MKTIKFLLGAALVGTLSTVSTFASTGQPAAAVSGPTDKPSVLSTVSPTELPLRHEGALVEVTLVVDASGQPHSIHVVSPADPALAKRLVPAISQWRFSPAHRNGVPIATRVVLPLQLVSSS